MRETQRATGTEGSEQRETPDSGEGGTVQPPNPTTLTLTSLQPFPSCRGDVRRLPAFPPPRGPAAAQSQGQQREVSFSAPLPSHLGTCPAAPKLNQATSGAHKSRQQAL